MNKNIAGKSLLGTCADLPVDARLTEPGGAARAEVEARLTEEIGRISDALSTASPELKKELILFVECLRAARQVVARSASFQNARG